MPHRKKFGRHQTLLYTAKNSYGSRSDRQQPTTLRASSGNATEKTRPQTLQWTATSREATGHPHGGQRRDTEAQRPAGRAAPEVASVRGGCVGVSSPSPGAFGRERHPGGREDQAGEGGLTGLTRVGSGQRGALASGRAGSRPQRRGILPNRMRQPRAASSRSAAEQSSTRRCRGAETQPPTTSRYLLSTSFTASVTGGSSVRAAQV